jgi:hypothetical protein
MDSLLSQSMILGLGGFMELSARAIAAVIVACVLSP